MTKIIPKELMLEFKEWIKTNPESEEGLGYYETFMKLRTLN